MKLTVVGPSSRFFSGMSIYTCRLSNALAERHDTSAMLMRRLLPARLYPGRSRIGADLGHPRYVSGVRVYDGIDWYWLPSMLGALVQLVRERPDWVIFEWWSGTVLHSYLLLASVARLSGARVAIEFHEVLDAGEARMPIVRAYTRALAPALTRLSSRFIVHSAIDRGLLAEHYDLRIDDISVIPVGPFDTLSRSESPLRAAPTTTCNLLYFGVIREYKGLEYLVEAFEELCDHTPEAYWLTVVGETWEKYERPGDLIGKSRFAARITFVNRYVNERDAAAYFAGADIVVLPYLRSSASGPLHIAMSEGKPVVVTAVGGLVEAVDGYAGAVLAEPSSSSDLVRAIERARTSIGQEFAAPLDWAAVVDRFDEALRTRPRGIRVGRTA